MPDELYEISAEEISNYVVCPEAWRLKYLTGSKNAEDKKIGSARTAEANILRKDWFQAEDLYGSLKRYAKIAYLLLVSLSILVFIIDFKKTSTQFSGSLNEILLLLLVLGLIIFIWDLFDRRSKTLRNKSGLSQASEVISLRTSSMLPSGELVSRRLSLRGKPDAVIREEGHTIPVEIRPLSNKVRDRHVVSMLTHLRIIEDAEGKRPPYGLLILGKDKRPVKIKYAEDKQVWLESLIDEMRAIHDGVPAMPAPAEFKCRQCDVRDVCRHRVG